MPEVITNSTASLYTGLETVNQAVVHQYQNVFILGKLSFRLLNLYSLAFYEYVYVHIDCRQKHTHNILELGTKMGCCITTCV